jgi:hypothetical protein
MNMIQQGAPGMACDAELDAVGLACPMPLLKAKLELNRLASGQVLKVSPIWPAIRCCTKMRTKGFTVTGCARPDGC